MYVFFNMYICVYVCMYACMYMCVCIYIYIYTYSTYSTHTHTHTHTHALTRSTHTLTCVDGARARACMLPAAKRLVFVGEFACILLHIWHTCILWLAATSLVPLCSQYMCSLCRMCSLYLRLLPIQLCSLNMCPLYMCALCRMCSLYLLAARTSEPCSLRSPSTHMGLVSRTKQPSYPTLRSPSTHMGLVSRTKQPSYPKPEHPQP